jgi:hypothetical protein
MCVFRVRMCLCCLRASRALPLFAPVRRPRPWNTELEGGICAPVMLQTALALDRLKGASSQSGELRGRAARHFGSKFCLTGYEHSDFMYSYYSTALQTRTG